MSLSTSLLSVPSSLLSSFSSPVLSAPISFSALQAYHFSRKTRCFAFKPTIVCASPESCGQLSIPRTCKSTASDSSSATTLVSFYSSISLKWNFIPLFSLSLSVRVCVCLSLSLFLSFFLSLSHDAITLSKSSNSMGAKTQRVAGF